MVQPITFEADVRFIMHNDYCICYQTTTNIHVVISRRLKDIIEREHWAATLPEDAEELRSLQELGLARGISSYNR